MASFFKILTIFFLTFVLTLKFCLACDAFYSIISEIENKVGKTHLLQETKASSLSFCGSLCINSCNCFGYNRFQKQCRLHVICDVGNMPVTDAGWRYYRVSREAKDCLALYQTGQTCSGVYTIYPTGGAITDVVCDMEIMGGGWTLIQNRFDGSENFNRTWSDYKNGFGSAVGEYWIGNDVIHELTKNSSSLYISITLNNGTTFFELYEIFSISSEADNYRLFIGGKATGTLGNRMTQIPAGDDLNGAMFCTLDRDNDKHVGGHCARIHSGGWWFNICHDAYLNGPYGSPSWNQPWDPPLSTGEMVQKTSMMIRRSLSAG